MQSRMNRVKNDRRPQPAHALGFPSVDRRPTLREEQPVFRLEEERHHGLLFFPPDRETNRPTKVNHGLQPMIGGIRRGLVERRILQELAHQTGTRS